MDDALQVVFPPLFDHYETLWPKSTAFPSVYKNSINLHTNGQN